MAAEVLEQAEPQPEEHDWPDLDFDRVRRFVVNQQGRDYVVFGGLIEALHQVSGGYFSIDTRIEQLPTQDNAQVAVVSARVQVYDPEQPDVVRRSATGIGDASPANVNRMMAGAVLRMAETRAKARALRDLCNVAMVALEELGPGGGDDNQLSAPERAAPPRDVPFTPKGAGGERIQVEGKLYDRPQVVAGYKRRLAEARQAGLAIPPADVLADDAPLSVLVGMSQQLRRRLEARDGAST